MNKKFISFLIYSSFSYSVYGHAQQIDCSEIKNNAKRLNCFDSQKKIGVPIENKNITQENEVKEKEKEKEKQTKILAINAYRALKKLNIKVETGLNYNEYISALADTKFEVNNFKEEESSNSSSEIKNSMDMAITHYETAKLVWSRKMAGENLLVNRDVNKILYEFYPTTIWKAESKAVRGRATPDAAISLIWSEASAEIKILGNLLQEK